MVVSVLRVYNFFIVLFLITSCKTIELYVEPINRTIHISQKQKKVENYNQKLENKKNSTTFKQITPGSISVASIFGSDIWIGKLGGSLSRYNLYTEDTTTFTSDIYSIKDYSIKKIIETKYSIVALQSDRIIEINKKNENITITPFPVNISRASDLVKYKDRVYISTLGYGLWEYKPYHNTFRDFIPDLKYISSLLIDGNTMYIGTMDNGLYVYDLIKKRIKSRLRYPLALFNKNIITMHIKNDILWLGCAQQGLIRWNTKDNSIERMFQNEGVSSIYIGENGKNAVSLIGSGIYIENRGETTFESIDTVLITNNITSVSIFNNSIISGNIKRGLLKQELIFLND